MALSVGHPRWTHSRYVIGCCLIPLEICGVKNNSRRITYGIECVWRMPSLPRLSSLDWNCFLSSVAKGGKWKKIEKLEEIWPTFTGFFLLLLLSLLDILMILNARWIIHFLTRTFISKAFASILQRSWPLWGGEFIYVTRGLIVTRIHDLEEHKVESIIACVCRCPGLSCSNVG